MPRQDEDPHPMPALTLQQILDSGLSHHQARRYAEAEACYGKVLAARPMHCDTLHLLGLVYYQTDRHEQALQLIAKAIGVQPKAAEYYNSLVAVYIELNQPDAAVAAGRRAVELQPALPEASFNLANALCRKKQYDAATDSYVRAISLRPTYAQAFLGLGNALVENKDNKRLEEAAAAYRKALELKPDLEDAHYNLGNALRLMENNAEAAALYRKAIAIKPDHLQAINNLACTLQQIGELDEALDLLTTARDAHPEKARVHSNLANVLADANRWDEAIVNYRKAIALQEDLHEARFNLSLALLMCGDFEQGWKEYESRWKCETFPSPMRYTQKPLWLGEPLRGRRILIHAEQGFGDTLQFARFVPTIVQRGGTVIFQVQAALHRLLKDLPGVTVVTQDLKPEEFDLQCPLWSLPLALGITLETIPPMPTGLFIDPLQQQQWQTRLADIRQAGDRLQIGIIWSGSPGFAYNYRRSIKLDKLAPLVEVPGVSFISLQKGPASSQAKILHARCGWLTGAANWTTLLTPQR
jgi:tetratricopeptide (TPR) repeat protein